jgi:hypothetical protein
LLKRLKGKRTFKPMMESTVVYKIFTPDEPIIKKKKKIKMKQYAGND